LNVLAAWEKHNLRDIILAALKRHNADYVEIRIEERERTGLSFRGRELEEVSRSFSLGGNVRALVNGGWGFVSFNSLDGLSEKVLSAVTQARMVGQEVSKLAEVQPVVAVLPLVIERDPRDVPLAKKKELLSEYTDLLWSAGPKIQTTRINYADLYTRKWFATSEGSFIEQPRVDIAASFGAVARDGDVVQQAGHSLGSVVSYAAVENQHKKVREVGERALRLLAAPPVKGGEYPVILDPRLAGVFVHEAFGHLSESDFVYENPRVKELMALGKTFGGRQLNIVDGAAIPALRGSYAYDDEGAPAHRTYLIKEGVLVGRLHSRETAGKMGERPTGNARAIDYRFPPIVRMTNTLIEPGQATLQDMLAGIKEGVYAKGSFGGETRMEMFTFSAEEAYMIRNGKIGEPVRGALLSGNVFTTLANIDVIGSDLEWNQGGGCGKGGQMPLPVGDASPHIRISRCVVGGR
jgi:TldD protein